MFYLLIVTFWSFFFISLLLLHCSYFILLLVSSVEKEFEFECFLRNTFIIDVNLRPDAEKCLNLEFFKKHTIPKVLQFDAPISPVSSAERCIMPSIFDLNQSDAPISTESSSERCTMPSIFDLNGKSLQFRKIFNSKNDFFKL